MSPVVVDAYSSAPGVQVHVDSPTSPKTCSAGHLGVTTLVPLSFEIVPDYAGEGKGPIYSAICAYPTAPIGWKPGADNPFTCKKTCVMC